MALCLILDMHETKMPIILDEMHVTYYIYSNLYGIYNYSNVGLFV